MRSLLFMYLYRVSVLLLAWSLGDVVQQLGTASFLAQAIPSSISISTLPPIAAIMAIVTSFATGSTFGTMGILFPLVVPLALEIQAGSQDAVTAGEIVTQCSAAILGFAVFGNCCSPIADTTVLVSVASGCPISLHVQTTMLYTFPTVGVALLATIATSLGIPSWVALPVAAVCLCAIFGIAVHGMNVFRFVRDRLLKKKNVGTATMDVGDSSSFSSVTATLVAAASTSTRTNHNEMTSPLLRKDKITITNGDRIPVQ